MSSNFRTKKYWQGGTGQNSALNLAFDGNFVYVGLIMTPGQIVKLNPRTMRAVATWVGGGTDKAVRSLLYNSHDGYLYAGLSNSTSGRVVQINRDTMATVATWNGAVGEYYAENLAHDDTSIYVVLSTTVPAKVRKIDPATMTSLDLWTGIAGEQQPPCILFAGSSLWVGLGINAGILARVCKVDPTTMTTLDRWTSVVADEYYIAGMTWDGVNYLYCALETSPSNYNKIVKIDMTTLLTVATWAEPIPGSYGQPWNLCYRNGRLYAGLDGVPGKVIKIDPETMTVIDSWTAPTGYTHARAIVADNFGLSSIYAGTWTTPGAVFSIGSPYIGSICVDQSLYQNMRKPKVTARARV